MIYNDKQLVCIALAQAECSGTQKSLACAQSAQSVEHLQQMLQKQCAEVQFSQAAIAVLKKVAVRSQLENIVKRLDENDIVCVTYYSAEYPDTLRHLPDPPLCLYCKGDIGLLKSRALAVVGTRKPNAYGRRVANNFVMALCHDFVIVSGLAYGIDSIAHEVTLSEHQKTVAVLGSGLNVIYPSANTGLAQKIVASGGLLVTEYPLDTQPKQYHFPQRNRIVSGLSQGVLVCQSPERSGTAVTVELALEQGKDVFVVPGEIYDFGFSGSNKLIKTMQAAMVTDPKDIANFYSLSYKDVQQQLPILSEDEQKVVDLLSDQPMHFNQIITALNMTPKDGMILLANMELKSIIAKTAGNMYRLDNGGNG